MIDQALQQPLTEKVADPEACLAWIDEINRAYAALERRLEHADQVVQTKLKVIFWRAKLLDRLLREPPPWAYTHQDDLLQALLSLNTYIPAPLQPLAGRLLTQPGLVRLMAQQGTATPGQPDPGQVSGPGADLNIVANRSSAWTFDKWSLDDRFSRYRFEQDGVVYRGVCFRPGDVLLTNVNLDGNGVYTALSEPRGFSSHSAFFAVLERRGLRFPAVIETYEKGLRPVPLNVFLGPRFCSYVEVYRHNDYAPEHADRINRSAAGFIESVRGYNFESEDEDPTYMSCTAVGRFLHRSAGLEPVVTISEIRHPNICANLAKLGYTLPEFFAPVDYLLNECMHHVGQIDNNQLVRLLAREAVDRELRRLLATRSLDPGKLPFKYRLNRWAVGHIRRQTPIGKFVSLVEGFDHRNLPRGPDDLIAAIKPVEKQLGKAIAAVRGTLEPMYMNANHLDLKQLLGDERVQRTLETSLELRWLPPD